MPILLWASAAIWEGFSDWDWEPIAIRKPDDKDDVIAADWAREHRITVTSNIEQEV